MQMSRHAVTDEATDETMGEEDWDKMLEDDWHESRRNILQVKEAGSVYAVGYRVPPDKETPPLDIGGGTGFACECYVNRFLLREVDKIAAYQKSIRTLVLCFLQQMR